MRTCRTLLSPRATLLSPHPMEKTQTGPQVMMSQVLSSLTCHEPYYAPVPQVDRGHQGHLGAGDRHHVLVDSLHYCQVEERRTALVQMIFISNCNYLKALFLSSSSLSCVILEAHQVHDFIEEEDLREDSVTLQ